MVSFAFDGSTGTIVSENKLSLFGFAGGHQIVDAQTVFLHDSPHTVNRESSAEKFLPTKSRVNESLFLSTVCRWREFKNRQFSKQKNQQKQKEE